MNPQRRKHFVILVHYGNAKQTDQALLSLVNCTLPPDKIIVIDHAKKAYHNTQHETYHIVRPQQNKGYAAGVNMGLGILISLNIKEHDIVIVANNDIKIGSHSLQQLTQWWRDNPADALLGVSIIENKKTLSGGGHVNLLSGRTHLHPKSSLVANRGFSKLNYIHGAFLSAPYRVFMKTKGMPEQYFLYWEDVLFSRRIRQLGIPLLTTDSIVVTHQQHKHNKENSDHLYYLVRNGALFLEKETSFPWRKYWWLLNRLRFIYHSLRFHRNSIVKLALRDAIQGVTGPRI
jgi:GT2 family glycosyltransferase